MITGTSTDWVTLIVEFFATGLALGIAASMLKGGRS